jgi:hypothetical protein
MCEVLREKSQGRNEKSRRVVGCFALDFAVWFALVVRDEKSVARRLAERALHENSGEKEKGLRR